MRKFSVLIICHVATLTGSARFETVLLEDGGEVGLGHVVGEGAVAEDDGGFSGGLQCLVPRHEAEGQRLHVGLRDGGREADEQRAAADGVDVMRLLRGSATCFRLDGHAEVEAELEEQLEEDVLLGAVGLEVLDGGFEGLGEVVAVRLPRPDVAAGELEDAEAEVAREQRVLLPNLLPGPAQAFFGQFGDGARLTSRSRTRSGLLVAVSSGSSGSGSWTRMKRSSDPSASFC